MLSVILTMFMWSDRDYIQTERFSSLAACEAYAKEVYKARDMKKSDARLRHHFCFEDF